MLQPEIGDIIDGFAITEKLHEGAAAFLFKAKDSFDTNRSVVLKIPRDNILNQPDLFYHYQNEENMSRYLNHHNVVRYLARKTSRLYLVQEHIDGTDLKTLLQRRKKLDCDIAVHICLKVCAALRYLHEKSIIHLDLKPENLMVQLNEDIKIIDFGLARHLGLPDLIGDDFSEPQGTPYYISPEQLCTKRDSPQSDIYSLGIIFYEMLTGNLPFEKSSKLSRVKMRMKKKPVPPRFYEKELHPALQQIVLRMLEPDLEKRYKTIKDVLDDLENYHLLEVTPEGLKEEKPGGFFDFILPADCSIYNNPKNSNTITVPVKTRQLLGCIIDDDISKLVVEELKREALTDGGHITLLTILEDDIEPQEVEHINEIAGSKLSKRIDDHISYLKKYDLDVTLRVKKGRPADQIAQMAAKVKADLTVLGPPRVQGSLNNLLSFFGGTTITRVAGSLETPLRVLKPASSGSGPRVNQKSYLSRPHTTNLKIFLIDIWVYHLNCLIQAIDSLSQAPIASVQSCPSGRWLDEIGSSLWSEELTQRLHDVHLKLHESIDEIIRLRQSGLDFRDIYKQQSLPLCERLKDVLEHAVKEQGGRQT
ncbi:MAG TPA: protein kinase [Desulfopila sp.]|nr:protein kinase [Desulfopila sp.]